MPTDLFALEETTIRAPGFFDTGEVMPLLFNNSHARDHAKRYGPRAFYDLDGTGRQATMAVNLERGSECVVATPVGTSEVLFEWFAFSHENVMRNEDDGAQVRVFFGERLRSETLTRAEAIGSAVYAAFFNVNGHFKRASVISPP